MEEKLRFFVTYKENKPLAIKEIIITGFDEDKVVSNMSLLEVLKTMVTNYNLNRD